jgi:branched-chain amino acid transport system permease protein
MLSLIGQLTVDGLVMGMVYVILSAGIVFIMSISGIFYLAYGQFYMMGAFATWAGVTLLKLPFGISLSLAVLSTGILGLLTYQLIFQYTTYAENKFMATIVAAIGLMMIFSQAGFITLGSSARSIPVVFPGEISVFGINMTIAKMAIVVITVVVTSLLFLFYAKTKIGRAMRAVSFLSEAASLMGINTKLMCMASVGIGTALAGFAGGIIAPSYGLVPEMGNNVIAVVLLIAMFGGIDSLMGSVVAGIIVGMVLSFGQYFLGSYSQILVFLIVGIVIAFRPGGLLGSREFGL